MLVLLLPMLIVDIGVCVGSIDVGVDAGVHVGGGVDVDVDW